jgi:hypothetical protein
MGFGLWKKIKSGLSKVIGGIGRAGKFIFDKVIKPNAGRIISGAGALIGGKIGGRAGKLIQTGAEKLRQHIGKNQVLEASPPSAVDDTDLLVPRLKGGGGRGIRRLASDQPAMLGSGGRGIRRLDLDES